MTQSHSPVSHLSNQNLKSTLSTMAKTVFGPVVDEKTRCIHYHLDLDVIAIKFKCCEKYYPCYKCHEETELHQLTRWAKHDLDTVPVILCGECKAEWSFKQYSQQPWCLGCLAKFNPGCCNHYSIYFDVD